MSLVSTDDNIPLICRGHSRPVCYIEHSYPFNDNFYLLSSCFDGEAHIRNGKTGDWIGTFKGHKGAVWSIKSNKNANLITTASADYTSKLWDGITGKEKVTFYHEKMVKDSIFSSDERNIISGGFEGLIRLWDIEKSDTPIHIFTKQKNPIKHLILNSLMNDIIISANTENNTLLSWDIRCKEAISEYKIGKKNEAITSMSITKDKAFIIVTTQSKVSFINAKKMVPLLEFNSKIPINCAALHPNGEKYIIGSKNFSVNVYSMDGNKLETHNGHHGPVMWVSCAPDGKTYTSSSEDGTIRIWQNKVEPYELWQKVKSI